jgi:hypothetical protein
MNTELKRTYKEASDFFTYVKLYAPGFPPRDEMTCQKALSRLFEYLETIEAAEQNTSAKHWLRVCREDLKSAAKLFEEEEHSGGRRAVGFARDHLNNAAQRKSVKPGFLVDEPGFPE